MTQKILIRDFPLPPSENKIYKNNKGSGRGRSKTSAYKEFEDHVFMWGFKNRPFLSRIKKSLQEWVQLPLGVVNIDFYFVFHRPKIIKRDGVLKLKAHDPLNYTKALCDSFGGLVDIDDSRFQAGKVVKCYCPQKDQERAVLVLSPSRVISFSEIPEILDSPDKL